MSQIVTGEMVFNLPMVSRRIKLKRNVKKEATQENTANKSGLNTAVLVLIE